MKKSFQTYVIVTSVLMLLLCVWLQSCEKEEIINIDECNESLGPITIVSRAIDERCGIYTLWDTAGIADRFAPIIHQLDLNNDNNPDVQLRVNNSYSPGGGYVSSILSILDSSFAFGVESISYDICLLGTIYYNQDSTTSIAPVYGSGRCNFFSEEEFNTVDTVIRRQDVRNYVKAFSKGDTIGSNIDWDTEERFFRRYSYQSGVRGNNSFGSWPSDGESYIAIRRLKEDGQVRYGWIRIVLNGFNLHLIDGWIQQK